MKPIAIIGAGGLGREILSMLSVLPEWQPLGFLDDNITKSTRISGLPVLGAIEDAKVLLNDVAAVIAIGDPRVKATIARRLEGKGLHFPTLIHPLSVLMNKDTISLGEGTVVGAGAVLTTHVLVGKHVLININATIGHDTKIGNHSSIMPGVNIAGTVSLGESVLVGAGASIRNGLEIGSGSTVAMGAAVIRDVPVGHTVGGVPAKGIGR